jgi:hypothetical protein
MTPDALQARITACEAELAALRVQLADRLLVEIARSVHGHVFSAARSADGRSPRSMCTPTMPSPARMSASYARGNACSM